MLPGLASTVFIGRVMGHLRAQGADPAPVALAAGLDPNQIDDPKALVPLRGAFAFYAEAATLLGDPYLGLHLALATDHRSSGVSGFVLANHPTLRGGVEEVGTISTSLIPELRFEMLAVPEGTRVVLRFSEPFRGAQPFAEEVLTGFYLRALKLVGGTWHPLRLELRGPERDAGPFTEALHAPVEFGCEADAITFADADLAREIPGADPSLLVHLRQSVEHQVAARRKAAGQGHEVVRLLGCTVDLALGEVRRDDGRVTLTERERQLIRYFAEHRNLLITHAALERDVWTIDSETVSFAPAVAIRRLRQKIEADPAHPVNLVTVFGEGWKLLVDET